MITISNANFAILMEAANIAVEKAAWSASTREQNKRRMIKLVVKKLNKKVKQ